MASVDKETQGFGQKYKAETEKKRGSREGRGKGMSYRYIRKRAKRQKVESKRERKRRIWGNHTYLSSYASPSTCPAHDAPDCTRNPRP